MNRLTFTRNEKPALPKRRRTVPRASSKRRPNSRKLSRTKCRPVAGSPPVSGSTICFNRCSMSGVFFPR